MAKSLLPFQLLLCCVLQPANAVAADKAPPPTGSLPELLQTVRASDTGSGRFRLELPVIGKPLLVNWQVGSAATYEPLRWSTYTCEALLLERGPLSVVALNRVVPAPDLDCFASTCAPMQERRFGVDLRLNLGGRGVVPDNYLFIRRQSVTSRAGRFTGVKLGIAGVLDL
jgi:hypothetical protein